MKFATYTNRQGKELFGLALGGEILQLSLLGAHLDQIKADFPNLREFVDTVSAAQKLIGSFPFVSVEHCLESYNKLGRQFLDAVALLMNIAAKNPEILSSLDRNLLVSEAEVKIIAPVPRPPSLRDGYAFRQHVETMRRNRGAEMIPEFDLFPIFYFGNHRTVFGPGDFPVQKLHLDDLDYELEVAVVIGRRGKNIRADKADQHVFGLCIMNDMSARHLQREEMKLSLGPAKGKDFGTILGPYLVTEHSLRSRITTTERGNRYNLRMTAAVNGKPLSDGNANSMNWTFAEIIERASYGVELFPGDVIGSGTVGTGCLAELNSSKITNNLWLKPGDTMTLEIEELGVLENRIVLTSDEPS